jgi:hypothetical protein
MDGTSGDRQREHNFHDRRIDYRRISRFRIVGSSGQLCLENLDMESQTTMVLRHLLTEVWLLVAHVEIVSCCVLAELLVAVVGGSEDEKVAPLLT